MGAIVSASLPASNQNGMNFHTAQRVRNLPADFVECHKQLTVGSLIAVQRFASEAIKCAYRTYGHPLEPIGRTES
jgi:hypothetical protein